MKMAALTNHLAIIFRMYRYIHLKSKDSLRSVRHTAILCDFLIVKKKDSPDCSLAPGPFGDLGIQTMWRDEALEEQNNWPCRVRLIGAILIFYHVLW